MQIIISSTSSKTMQWSRCKGKLYKISWLVFDIHYFSAHSCCANEKIRNSKLGQFLFIGQARVDWTFVFIKFSAELLPINKAKIWSHNQWNTTRHSWNFPIYEIFFCRKQVFFFQFADLVPPSRIFHISPNHKNKSWNN